MFAFISSFFNEAMWIKHFPIERRFAFVATIFGIATAIGHSIAAFAFPLIASYIGHYVILVLYIPSIAGVLWGLSYLKKLEIKRGCYHNYPNEPLTYPDTAANEEDFNYNLDKEYEPFQNQCEYSTQLLDQLHILSEEQEKKVNIKLIEKAITFAKYWHRGQTRKTGNMPFYSHTLAVAQEVAKHQLKTDMIVAAILHDVVEDSECTVELIEKEFNARIAQIVDGLTKVQFENGKKITLSLDETIERLQKMEDSEALFIKKIDRIHNLETIEGLQKEKQEKMARETSALTRRMAIIGDKLGVQEKIQLEDKLFEHSFSTLNKDEK